MKKDPKRQPGKRPRPSRRRFKPSQPPEGSKVARRSSSGGRPTLAPANGTLRVIAFVAGQVREVRRFPATSRAVIRWLQAWANDRNVMRLELHSYDSGAGWKRIWKQNRLPHDLGPLFSAVNR